jgi:peptidoglycan/LPS O-acetylase OafA/YrhL
MHRQNPHRLGCIDGLRGYLALGVYLTHFLVTYNYKLTGEWARPQSRFFGNCGDVAVSLFFMITGFLFLNRLLENRDQGRAMNWGRFYTTRIFRLIPLYAFCVAVIFVIVFAAGGAELRETPVVLVKRALQWMLLMTPNINGFPRTSLIIAGVTWTLRYEWVFYLTLPLIAWMLRGRGKILLLLSAALTVYFYVLPATIPYISLFTPYFILFWAGGLTAYAYRFENLRGLAREPATSGVAIAALLAVLFGFDNALGTLPILLMTVFFVSVALGNSLGGLLNLRTSILLGNISYSIYLLHGIVLYLVFSIFAPNAMQSATHIVALWLWMPLVGSAVVALSWLTHRYVEQPGITLGKKITTRLHRVRTT